MSLLSKLIKIQEERAKRLTLSQLRLMSDRQLIDCGFSPQLISEGVSAWPWRELPEVSAPLLFKKGALPTVVSKDPRQEAFASDSGNLLSQDAA